MGKRIKDIVSVFKEKKKPALIIAGAIIIIVAIILSELFSDNEKQEVSESPDYIDYANQLEEKLEDIVCSISGAGECKVMITLDTGEENVYARQVKNQNEDKTESSKTSDEYEYVVLKSSSSKEEGMLLKIIEPNVRGVAVVCRGGDDPLVKENIISAISCVLDIKTNKISITKMK